MQNLDVTVYVKAKWGLLGQQEEAVWEGDVRVVLGGGGVGRTADVVSMNKGQ